MATSFRIEFSIRHPRRNGESFTRDPTAVNGEGPHSVIEASERIIEVRKRLTAVI
jgi:hypothetical protein